MLAVRPVRFVVASLLGTCLWLILPVSTVRADDTDRGTTFAGLIRAETLRTLSAVSQYIADHPEADDVNSAYRWVFETAMSRGLETEALETATACLSRGTAAADVLTQARMVQCLGWAEAGDGSEAVAGFLDYLRTQRVRSPNQPVDFALRLAAKLRLAGEFDSAGEVSDQLSTKFILNPQVREICANHSAKLDLVGKPAPPIVAHDLNGDRIDLGTMDGQVVLVDFWATNCPPCLEEFPRMTRLYADHHKRGFEIVGISLDQQPDLVKAFLEEWEIPWRITLDADLTSSLRPAYNVMTIPSLFLIDRQGRVRQFDVRGADLETAVGQLVSAQAGE